MQLVNTYTYKNTLNQALDNAWIKDYVLSYDHLQEDIEEYKYQMIYCKWLGEKLNHLFF